MRYGPEDEEVARHVGPSDEHGPHPHIVRISHGPDLRYFQEFLVFAGHADKAIELLRLDIEATIKALDNTERASLLRKFLEGSFEAREINGSVYPVSYFDDYRSVIRY